MRVGAARRRVRLPERLHIGGRAGNTRLQHRPVGPRGELAREAGIAVHRQRGLDLARFDQHVAEVQEESLEVVRRDPRVPANALRPLPRLEPHVARVVRVRAVDPLGDADVEVAPLLLERVAVAFGVDRLGRGGVAGGEQVELGPRRHRVLHREVAAAHHLLVLVDGAFRHQQARVEAQVPRFLGIEAHRLLEVLAREHRVVGDLGADRLVPRPLAEPPDVHPPDVRSGDRVVGCGDVRGLERGQRGRDAVVGSAVQRGPEDLVGLHRGGGALGTRALLRRGPDRDPPTARPDKGGERDDHQCSPEHVTTDHGTLPRGIPAHVPRGAHRPGAQ